MKKISDDRDRTSPVKSTEFWIIMVLIVALLITEALVFWLVAEANRGDVLALTFGAFGAWIGAGAAYFFGRENMRAATDSMLKMRGRSSTEVLADTTLADMNPKPLPKKFTMDSTMGDILKWLEEDKERFFIVVVDDKGKFECSVHEEAFYRFMHEGIKKAGEEEPSAPLSESHEELCGKSVSEVIEYFKMQKNLQSLIQAAVKLNESHSALTANEIMERERKFITIVVDAENCPVGYVTTGDIRRLLAKSG